MTDIHKCMHFALGVDGFLGVHESLSTLYTYTSNNQLV